MIIEWIYMMVVGVVRVMTVGAKYIISVGAVRVITVGAKYIISVGAVRVMTVGAKYIISVGAVREPPLQRNQPPLQRHIPEPSHKPPPGMRVMWRRIHGPGWRTNMIMWNWTIG